MDEDTRAFNRVMDAFRLPKATGEQLREREVAVEEATKGATRVPLEVLKKSVELLRLAKEAAKKGNKNSVSDAGVAGLAAQAAADGAYYNIRINLPGIKDAAFKKATALEAEQYRKKAEQTAGEVRRLIRRELK